MEIRYVNQTDNLLEISRIYESSWRHAYKDMIPQDYLDRIPTGHWASHMNKAGLNHLVTLENGLIIGTASFCKSRWEQYKNYGEIVSIYFLPAYMGKGYGTHLLKRCVEELKRLGYGDILLWVLEDNRGARRFYEKNGFICSGVYINDDIGGRGYGALVMAFIRAEPFRFKTT